MNDWLKSLAPRCLLVCTLAAAGAAQSASQDDDFLRAAREAFRAGDAVRLERYAKSLSGYTLEPCMTWRFRLRLDEASPSDIRAMLARLQDTPVVNSLRTDWSKQLAVKQQWELFDTEYPLLEGTDAELLCYSLQSRLRAGGMEPWTTRARYSSPPRPT